MTLGLGPVLDADPPADPDSTTSTPTAPQAQAHGSDRAATFAATDPGAPESPGSVAGNPPAEPESMPDANPCWYENVPYSADSTDWAGRDPKDGTVAVAHCPQNVGSLFGQDVRFEFVWDANLVWLPNGAVPPPPGAEDLARTAIGQLKVPDPELHVGPDPDTVAVKIPVWLWIADPGPLSVTVTAGALSVTATATITATDWSMGEPEDPTKPSGATIQAVTCTGTGTPPPDAASTTEVTPPCGYSYYWKSTPERTDGTGRWPLSVDATWTVTWQATNGQRGSLDLHSATTTALQVREYRTVLVAPTG